MARKKIDEIKILQLELRKCFNYFIKESNNNKSGYRCPGAEPCDADLNIENDGTVASYGAIASIIFTPKESIEALD